MDERLGLLDRATLWCWGLAKTSSWTLVAFLAGVVIHVGFVGLSRHPAIDLFPHVPYQFLATAGLSTLVGLAIGSIVGRRAWRWQPRLAVLAASAYALAALGPLRALQGWPTKVTTTIERMDGGGVAGTTSIGPAGRGVTVAYGLVVIVLTIGTAWLRARRASASE